MPTTYTPNDASNPATITLPSDADGATAESVNAALRALGDKSAFAVATRAALAALNTFTRGQIINPPTEVEALLSSSRFPGQLTVDNRWSLIAKFNIEASTTLRMYTGGLSGVGRLAWTINAHWNIDDQLWELEDSGSPAAAILWNVHTFTVHNVASGTSPFLAWPATPSAGTEGTIRAVGEFRYASAKNRIRTIPLATVSGLYSVSGADGSVGTFTIGDHSYIRWPIRLPPGAVLQKISVLHFIDASAVETFKLTRRRQTWDEGSPTTAPETVLFSADSDTSTGAKITTMVTSGTAVDRYDDLSLLWIPSGILFNNVHGIIVEWADQGPTPI
jgi:hypothetical protein